MSKYLLVWHEVGTGFIAASYPGVIDANSDDIESAIEDSKNQVKHRMEAKCRGLILHQVILLAL